MDKTLLILSIKEPFLWALMRILRKTGKGHINVCYIASEKNFDEKVISGIIEGTVILINTAGNTPEWVKKWVWRKLRLNENKIGKARAGLPVIVLGMGKKFLETQEGKVFRDFPPHHKYIPKPVNLYDFLTGLGSIYPLRPHSLCVIKGDAPNNLVGALEHDLNNILKKFDFEGNSEKLKERFQKIEIDLSNYKKLTKNRKTLAKLTKKVKILKDEILKKRGNIWH